ncbi:INORGANIC PHOSPHATE TRANSPORTER [Encephalitozoon cuniculi GB-M1]|uniref:INORGANIC PHOSPHATE TRANSPORTER n=2 Tax=Encephalitozoon cuniculi TaxID=6035 RepID=Q8SQS7_ENCCU|nr:inorganic phosphate transport protein [Encephalitozoon cuniculi GB-M1]AGE94974.1 inorganic phosphate transporter [Encephalitozoon cuniculi]KMV65122.1 inorganic phosphate transport protein [Encephalitozoon cuniculi EcunIII-L]UYI26371.1 phosphate transport protein [Encephalitozoon cuniculi]CAD26074.1 INORGANIC PHOSPHATE TRANSPORTER [Encephalitozoon cuniculi GB-M1]
MSLSVVSVDQFVNFALSIASMKISGRPMFQTPKAIWILRGVYLCSNLIQLMFSFYIMRKIKKTNDCRKVKIKKEASLFRDGSEEEEEEMTYASYDESELTKISRTAVIQFLIISVLHFKWKVIQPLFVQSFVPLRNLFLSPLYTAYVWNRPVLRPFEANMLFQKIPAAPEKKRIKED